MADPSGTSQIPLTMPKMSMTMEEGTLVEWSVAEGDTIAKGDVVAVVMTDKVDMEVESPAAGTIASLVAGEGDVIAVGEPIAMIASEEEDLLGDLFTTTPDSGPESEDGVAAAAEGASSAPLPTGAEEAAGARTGAGDESSCPVASDDRAAPPAVPLARKLTRDHGLDLREIPPTGPHGTVRVKDVKQAIEREGARRADRTAGAAPSAGPARTAPADSDAGSAAAPAAPVAQAAPEELLGDARSRRTRRLTAQAMAATAVIPQFTAFRRLDLSAAARARTGVLKGISWTTLIVRAYAQLLRTHEQLNGSWAGDGVKRNDEVGVVLAVDTPGGLMVPVLRDPDQRGVRELDSQVRELAAAAKEGRIDPALLGPGTGTVSNLGGMGVDRFNALITPPQATALSVGGVGFVPVVEDDGTITGRMSCEVGLSIDHRAADGADAARALQFLQDRMSDPLQLAL